MASNELPLWLSDQFVTRFLRLVENTDLDLSPVKVTCREAVPPGSNFMSDVFAVSVSYKSHENIDKTSSFFVKAPLPLGPKTDFLRTNRVYERETKMYDEILPKLYSLHSARIAPLSFPLVPAENSLVLEDLRESGHRVLDRLQQMDFQHCRHVLVALAKFHGATVKLQRKEKHILENFGHHVLFNYEELSAGQQQGLVKVCKAMLNDFVKVLSEMGCEKFSSLVRDFTASYWERIVSLLKPGNHLSVLCHGDCWMSNMMFKHVNGKCVDVKFVDFQTSFHTSYAFDLLMFWWSSADENARECHREELFEVYRTALNNALEELQCDEQITKVQFDGEIQRLAPFALYVIAFTASACLADPDDFFDMKVCDVREVKEGEESPMMKNLRSKYFTRSLPKLMEQAERFGMFSC